MTGNQGFALHPAAAQDITEIWEFIAAHNTVAAGNFREEILEAVRNLAKFPHSGHIRPDLTSRPLRFQVVRDYLIAYTPNEKPLVVLAVIHGHRSPRIIAATLHARK